MPDKNPGYGKLRAWRIWLWVNYFLCAAMILNALFFVFALHWGFVFAYLASVVIWKFFDTLWIRSKSLKSLIFLNLGSACILWLLLPAFFGMLTRLVGDDRYQGSDYAITSVLTAVAIFFLNFGIAHIKSQIEKSRQLEP